MDVHKAAVKMFRMLYQRHIPESETDLETESEKTPAKMMSWG